MSAEEELLASLVSREITDDDPRAIEAYARDPGLLATVARLRQLGERLESVGYVERDALGDPSSGEHVNEVLQAKIRQRVLEHHAAGTPESESSELRQPALPAQRPWGSFARVASAAAALLVIGLGLKLMLPKGSAVGPSNGPSNGPTELHLGARLDFEIEPTIDGDTVTGLTWKEQDLRGGRTYTLRYTGADGQVQVVDTGLYESWLELDDPLSWNEETNLEVLVVDTQGREVSQGTYRD